MVFLHVAHREDVAVLRGQFWVLFQAWLGLRPGTCELEGLVPTAAIPALRGWPRSSYPLWCLASHFPMGDAGGFCLEIW